MIVDITFAYSRVMFVRSLLALLLSVPLSASLHAAEVRSWSGLREINPPESPTDDQVVAIVGATLIDGLGGAALPDSTVLVRGGRIEAVGKRGLVAIPKEASRVNAEGLYLLPGMFDAHFHISRPLEHPHALSGGFTSLRDLNRPVRGFSRVVDAGSPMPRTFVTGPAFDQKPHAHTWGMVDIQEQDTAEELIDQLHREGASAIKIYYRLPLELIQASCSRAHRHGMPVVAHLELVRADAAIRAGVDGIEHVTSLGTAMATEEDARAFEAGVRADNTYRNDGRYWLWSRLQLEGNPKVQALLDLMLERGIYLTPTLRPFEVQPGSKNFTEEKLAGFEKMKQFVKIAHRAGVPIVASSHGLAGGGEWRELELLADAGLSPNEVLETASTIPARYFGVAERLGTVEPGKEADLVLLQENPLADISAVRKVDRVMLAGRWVSPESSE